MNSNTSCKCSIKRADEINSKYYVSALCSCMSFDEALAIKRKEGVRLYNIVCPRCGRKLSVITSDYEKSLKENFMTKAALQKIVDI